MRFPHIPLAIHRLRVRPDQPAEGPPAVEGPRRPGSRRIHNDQTVARVRHLVETTGLSYREIGAKVGIPHSNITGWKRDFGWQRPAYAPRHKDEVPTARAGRRLKLRRLAEQLRALAERAVRELEEAPTIDVEAVMRALQVLKMARLEAMGGRGRRSQGGFWFGPPVTGAQATARDEAIRRALREMKRGGVDIAQAPQEAVDLVIEANTPVEESRSLRPGRGRRSQREAYHRWLMQKVEE